MYIAHKKFDYRLTEIATAFGLKHYGGVANSIYLIEKKFKNNQDIVVKLNAIIKRLDP